MEISNVEDHGLGAEDVCTLLCCFPFFRLSLSNGFALGIVAVLYSFLP